MHISVPNSYTTHLLSAIILQDGWLLINYMSRLWNVCQRGSHHSGVSQQGQSVSLCLQFAVGLAPHHLWLTLSFSPGSRLMPICWRGILKENFKRSYQSHFAFTSFRAITCEHVSDRYVGKNYDPTCLQNC